MGKVIERNIKVNPPQAGENFNPEVHKYLEVDKYIEKYPKVKLWIILTQRYSGKTFSVGKWLLNQAMLKDEKFTLARRDNWEVKATSDRTFDKVIENANAKRTIAGDKELRKIKLEKNIFYYGKQEIGQARAVSLSQKEKGGYHPLYSPPQVSHLFLDEFVSEKGIYQATEPALFAGLCFTYAQLGKIIMTGNPISVYNPYLSALGIDDINFERNSLTMYKKGLVAVLNITRYEGRKMSEFERIFAGVDGFGQMITGRQKSWLDEYKVEKIPKKASEIIKVKIDSDIFKIYAGRKGKLFIEKYKGSDYDQNIDADIKKKISDCCRRKRLFSNDADTVKFFYIDFEKQKQF